MVHKSTFKEKKGKKKERKGSWQILKHLWKTVIISSMTDTPEKKSYIMKKLFQVSVGVIYLYQENIGCTLIWATYVTRTCTLFLSKERVRLSAGPTKRIHHRWNKQIQIILIIRSLIPRKRFVVVCGVWSWLWVCHYLKSIYWIIIAIIIF